MRNWGTSKRNFFGAFIRILQRGEGGGGGGGLLLHKIEFLFEVACFRELSRVLKSRSEVYTEYSIKWIWEISS